jgi:hypothetical protein
VQLSTGIGEFQRLLLEILASSANAVTITELTSSVRVHTGRRNGALRYQIYIALRQLKARGMVFLVKEDPRKTTSRYRVALSPRGRVYAIQRKQVNARAMV